MASSRGGGDAGNACIVDRTRGVAYRGIMHIGRIKTAHPVGAIFLEAEGRRPMATRASGAAILVACTGLFAAASWLDPARGSTDSLEQFGLPPCGMLVRWGVPCPTCGMTTSFALAARGQLASAFHAQPAGLALAVAAAVAAIAAGGTLVTGRSFRVNWYRVSPTGIGLGVAAILLAGWAYKIVTTLWR